MQLMKSEARYSLVIRSYPSESSIIQVSELIYGTADVKLMASLSSLPFSVGRSFSPAEAGQLAESLKTIKVGYIFKGLTHELPSIEFDPDKKAEASEQTEKMKTKKRFSILQIFGWSLVVAGGALAIWFAIAHNPISLNEKQNTESNAADFAPDVRAKISRIVKNVEFRRDRDLVWSKAELETALKDSDAVRTFEDSLATLRYREGSTVLVKPNTLVVVRSEGGDENRKIHLDDGAVSAKLQSTETPQKWSIVTKVGTLELESPKPGAVESKVETSISGDRLKVAVTQGRALLRSNAKDHPSVEIKSLESVEATPTEVSAITPVKLEVLLQSPQDSAIIQVDPNKAAPIRFEWTSPESGDVDYEWMVATDPEMKNILLSQRSKETHVAVNYLDLGTLYWKVKGSIDGTTYESRVQKLHVQKHQ